MMLAPTNDSGHILAWERPAIDTTSDKGRDSILYGGKEAVNLFGDFFCAYECPVEGAKFEELRKKAEEGNDEELEEAKRGMLKFPHENKKYLNILQSISDGKCSHLNFSIDDYCEYLDNELETTNDTEKEYMNKRIAMDILQYHSKRAIRLITAAADTVRNLSCPPSDNADLMHQSVLSCMRADSLDAYLRAPFTVTLIPRENARIYGIRDITPSSFGSLMKFDVIVAKVFSAQPKMIVAAFSCKRCLAKAWQPIFDEEFNPARSCMSESCTQLGEGKGGELEMILKETKMVLSETVLGQEPASHVPQGNVPRRRQFILEGDLARQLTPGTQCTISGIPEPVFRGNRGFGDPSEGNRVRDTLILGQHITVHKSSKGLKEEDQQELERRIEELVRSENLYSRLAASIAPSVWGMDDVKKALLLQLIGAPKLATEEGLVIRGELHILLMGDPGVAKSQLLGKITKLAPRSSYTSGKSASGVGLTASIFKDPTTGEFSLEGGAVVIADTGICAIDEFDKLDETDRTAIHEVMEQQTVSISKAGLNVQLSARTAILAAANPTYGRYDVTKSLINNMNLPYSLISRFDLQFLLLDDPDEVNDRMLARHILKVHQGAAKVTDDGVDIDDDYFIDPTTLRHFILRCQSYTPMIPEPVTKLIQQKYVDIRVQERLLRSLTGEEEGYTTPRTLFSIVRLAQAHARIRFSNVVCFADVEEAVRLMESSKKSVKNARNQGRSRRSDRTAAQSDPVGEILEMLRKLDKQKSISGDYNGYISVAEAEQMGTTNGYSKAQVNDTIKQYADLNLLWFRSETDGREFGFSDVLDKIKEN